MTSKIDLYYITASFPFGMGESFIGPEIKEWTSRGRRVCVVPLYPRGQERKDSHLLGAESYNVPLLQLNYFFYALWWFIRKPKVVCRLLAGVLRQPVKFPKNALSLFKAFKVASHVTRNSATHIHAHWGGTTSTMAMAIAELTNVPWSVTCHRWDIYENNMLSWKSENSSFMRFISEQGMCDAFNYGVIKEKSYVIHMGVEINTRPQRRAKAAKCLKIACAANLIEVKGHRYLIDAMKILKDRDIDAKLSLYGVGPLYNALVDQVSQLGLTTSVIFMGQKPQEELFAIYKNHSVDIFVLPSIQISKDLHEGIPVSLMEAMSFGIPVVATQTGSIEELLPRYLELTVPDRDPLALATVMCRLASDSDFYAKTSTALGSLIYDKWRVEHSVDALERLIFQDSSNHLDSPLSEPTSDGAATVC